MDPNTDEADAKQLELAREQGESYRKALEHMANDVAHDGGMQEAGEYLIGYAVEEAEGMYMWEDGELDWQDPEDENLHVEIAVCDALGRALRPLPEGHRHAHRPRRQRGRHARAPDALAPDALPLRAQLEGPGRRRRTRCKVRVEPPTFMRHDDVNGCRFKEPVETTFENVKVERGQG